MDDKWTRAGEALPAAVSLPNLIPANDALGLAPEAAHVAGAVTTRKFFGDVLPAQGPYRLLQFFGGRKPHTHWTDSLDGLTALAVRFAGKTSIYFGTASYRDKANGTGENVRHNRALRLDIDAGPAKLKKQGASKVYATQADARSALDRFTAASGLQPTYILSSGEGLHVYYVLTDELEPAQWAGYAKRLANLAAQHGLLADSTVTEDVTRILRVPGTMHEGGNRVEILEASEVHHSLESLSHLLDADMPGNVLASVPPTTTPGERAINSEVLGASERTYPPSSAFKVVNQCGALRQVVEARGDVPEPLWRAMVGLVKHTVEGDEQVHDWSQGYEGYDWDETQKKIDGWKLGPTTCDEFNKHSPACAACPHRGRIKSPIALGVERLLDGPIDGSSPQISRAVLLERMPDWLYRQSPDGGPPIKYKLLTTTSNLAALAEILGISIRYDLMARRARVAFAWGELAGDHADEVALTILGDYMERAGMSRTNLPALVDAVASQDEFHPALEWIESQPWDGVDRLPQLYATLELADESKRNLAEKLIRAWLIQAVAALVENGIAAALVLVLAGPQDVNKTRWVLGLCPVEDSVLEGKHVNPLDKDSVLAIVRAWIVELGELETTTRRSDIGALKAFLTSSVDTVRLPYARRDSKLRRRTVFAASVNEPGFLVDTTGNRRFGVIEVTHCTPPPADLMQQIWAQVLTYYRAGERWYLDAETKAELAASNLDHTATDPLRERIATGFNWGGVNWVALHRAMRSTERQAWRDCADVAWLSATDVCRAVGIDRPSPVDATRAGRVVRDLHVKWVKAAQGTPGELAIKGTLNFSRKSNGVPLLAVPSRRGGEQ